MIDLIYASLPNWNKISWRKQSGTLADYHIDDDRSHDGNLNGAGGPGMDEDSI